jgi:acyl carrier protein
VAANAFLDALAYYRCAQGRPALSINWGPWSEVGLAAAQANRGERLEFRGLGSITPQQGVVVLEHLMRHGAIQVGVMPFDVQQWRAFYPAGATAPLFDQLMDVCEEKGQMNDKGWLSRSRLRAMEPGERQQSLAQYLEEQLAKVLGLLASTLSKLDVHQPLKRLGIDSLMVVELKNRIELDLGVDIPVVKFLQGLTLADLTTLLLTQLAGETLDAALVAVPEQPADDQGDSLLLSSETSLN